MKYKRLKKRLRIINVFPFLVLCYILAAFLWWTVLIYREINENYSLRTALYKMEENVFTIEKLKDKHTRDKRMLIGEAAFISLSILTISYFLIRSLQKEIKVKTIQNNFILSVTHELKSPLSAMQLAFQTLLKQKVTEEQKIMLVNQGLKETGRLSNLVDNILLAARIERNIQLHKESIDIKSFFEQQIMHFSMLYADQKFKAKIDPDICIHADRQALESIVKNIISNAIKYSIAIKNIEIEVAEDREYSTLTIKDQGIGIPEESRKKIFEKFYRLNQTKANNNSGTGLGLYIVQELIDAHQGKVEILDNTPSGTIFRLKFPNVKS